MAKIREFEAYLNKIIDPLVLEKKEKDELKEELNQHLMELMNGFIQKGLPKNEAIKQSIKQFGEVNLLLPEMKKSFLPPWEFNILKEMFVWLFCLFAASIGPILLINAHYRVYFVTGTLFFLAICCVVYHIIVRRLFFHRLWLISLPLLYGCFVYFIIHRSSLEYYLSQLLSIDLNGDGLFTISIIHLLWTIIIAKHLIIHSIKKQQWLTIIRASFEYWAMIMLGFFITITEIITNSGEGKVMLLNIFLLYVFLQQVIDPKIFIQNKQGTIKDS